MIRINSFDKELFYDFFDPDYKIKILIILSILFNYS